MATTTDIGTPRPAEMRHITRYEHRRAKGWWVRIHRRPKKNAAPVVTSRFFSDGIYGSKSQALAAAKKFRDVALETSGPSRHVSRRPTDESSYGYVRRMVFKRRDDKTDTAKLSKVWYAWHTDPKLGVQHTRFSILHWGDAAAKEKAEAWLAERQAAARRGRRATRTPRAAAS